MKEKLQAELAQKAIQEKEAIEKKRRDIQIAEDNERKKI